MTGFRLKAVSALVSLLGGAVAHAAGTQPQVTVQDPSGCISATALKAEMATVLAPGRDHGGYAVAVMGTGTPESRSVTLHLMVEHVDGATAGIDRELQVRRDECADQVRVVARIAAKAMDGAPVAEEPLAVLGGEGVQERQPPPKAPSPDQVPEGWIDFDREVVVTMDSHGSNASVEQYDVPVQGPYRRKMSWPEFYEATGHPDMASTFKRNTIRRYAMYGTGVAAVVGGALLGSMLALVGGLGGAAAGVSLGFALGRNSGEEGSIMTAGLGVGLALTAMVIGGVVGAIPAAAGVATTWVGVLLPVQPAEPHEVRQMADTHNRALVNPAPAE